jgi:hypothetical protein
MASPQVASPHLKAQAEDNRHRHREEAWPYHLVEGGGCDERDALLVVRLLCAEHDARVLLELLPALGHDLKKEEEGTDVSSSGSSSSSSSSSNSNT